MKKQILLVLSAAALFVAGNALGQVVNSFDDLKYWGTGSNQSALVVSWNDGTATHTLAWGFRWDGTAPTLFDTLTSIAAMDPRFFLRIDSATNYGPSLFGIGYQTGSAAFGITGAQNTVGDPVTPVFTDGVNDTNTDPLTTQAPFSSITATATNSSDYYEEGWNDNGFWNLYFSGTDPFTTVPGNAYPTTWTAAWVGAGSVNLVDDGWYAFSFAPNFVDTLPGAAVAAVPEPGSVALILFAAGVLFVISCRHRSLLA